VESQELSEKLLGLIHAMATAALAVAPENREAWLERNRQNCLDEAVANKLGLEQAKAWADQIDTYSRLDALRLIGRNF
jgi:hypothetical protein